MANKHLFKSRIPQYAPPADTKNLAGGAAYAMSSAHALAQMAVTGSFSPTFYASAEAQLTDVLSLAQSAPPELVAKTAIYARQRGLMKDMPALLMAIISKDPELLARIFSRVIDDAKMLRVFVQMIRSGVTGRRSLGHRPKKLIEAWLDVRTDEQVFFGSVGNDPSLRDVLKLAHPCPKTPSRRALYAYLVGAPHQVSELPPVVRHYEDFKAGRTLEVPDVPFQMLTSLPLSVRDWASIAERATFTQTRMNLNTFARQGVFSVRTMTEKIAAKLRNRNAVQRSRVFPYQLMTSYHATLCLIPREVSEALQDAMEIALSNVPKLLGEVHVLVDVSGSMRSPVTGVRPGATTVVRCVDVAALFGAAMLRTNRHANVMAFEHSVVKDLLLNSRDTAFTNAEKLAAVGGGGTNCAAPLADLNARRASGDLVIFVSDNESWIDSRRGASTGVMHEWQAFRARNPRAKLVCIDLTPNRTTQAPDREDIMNIGGFSDAVFETVAAFHEGRGGAEYWLNEIRAIDLAA